MLHVFYNVLYRDYEEREEKKTIRSKFPRFVKKKKNNTLDFCFFFFHITIIVLQSSFLASKLFSPNQHCFIIKSIVIN